MRQPTCIAPGRLEWRDVTAPELAGDGGALIRPIAVARCEIDPMLIGAGPVSPVGFAVGHEAIAPPASRREACGELPCANPVSG
jgi:hypothetical protein